MTDEDFNTQDLNIRLDDTLVDLRALAKFAICVSEICTREDFGMLQGEFNTLFHMMVDKVDTCSDASDGIAFLARQEPGEAQRT